MVGVFAFGAVSDMKQSPPGTGMHDFLGLGEEDCCLGIFYMGYPVNEWSKGYRKPWVEFVKWEE